MRNKDFFENWTGSGVDIELIKEQSGFNAFKPLKLPSGMGGKIKGDVFSGIKSLRLQSELSLKSGKYEFHLTEGEPFLVEIPEKCTVFLNVTGALIKDGNDFVAVITDTDLEFSQPVILPNVWATLGKLPHIFDDNDLKLLFRFVENMGFDEFKNKIRNSFDELKNTVEESVKKSPLAETRIGQGLGSLWNKVKQETEKFKRNFETGNSGVPMVMLRSAKAAPVKNRDRWELEFMFSGEVAYPDKSIMPFDDIKLPHVIIPSLHAELDALLSDNPFASASLKLKNIPAKRLMKEFAAPADVFSGKLTLEGEIPEIRLVIPMHDGGKLGFKVKSSELVRLSSSFSGFLNEQELEITSEYIEIEDKNHKSIMDASFALDTSGTGKSPVSMLIDAATDEGWEAVSSLFSSVFRLHPGFMLSSFDVVAAYRHPLVRGGDEIPLKISDFSVEGYADVLPEHDSAEVTATKSEFLFSGKFGLPEGYSFRDGGVFIRNHFMQGDFSGSFTWDEKQGFNLKLDGKADVNAVVSVEVEEFPELNLEKGIIPSDIKSSVQFGFRLKTKEMTDEVIKMVMNGSFIKLKVNELKSVYGNYSFYLSAPALFEVMFGKSELSTEGTGSSSVKFRWNLNEKSPVLANKSRKVEILVDELLSGSVNLNISPYGSISFSGMAKGLYNADFFNGIINPEEKLQKWFDLIEDEETFQKISLSAGIFSEDLQKYIVEFRKFILKVSDILKNRNIEKPGDFLPAEVMASVISEALTGNDKYEKDFLEIIMQVVRAEGLNVKKLRSILEEVYSDYDISFELGKGLKWLDLVLSPGEKVDELIPFEIKPLFKSESKNFSYDTVLSAAEIYDAVLSDSIMSYDFSKKLNALLPYLSFEQLEWLNTNKKDNWDLRLKNRISYICSLKRKIKNFEEYFGGFNHILQPTALSFFLYDVTADSKDLKKDLVPEAYSEFIAASVLGPRDTAVLLRSVLASPVKGRTVQINFIQLFNMIKRQPSEFAKQVLVEISDGSSRILTNILYGLFEFSLGTLRTEENPVKFFEQTLNLTMPKRADFMAGGRFARKSYYHALFEVSEKILESASDYPVLKAKLQIYANPEPAQLVLSEESSLLLEKAVKTIEKADKAGSKCTFSPREKKRRETAVKAYVKAFESVKTFLKSEKEGFKIKEIKEFISRNYEALMILSVVKNYEENTDKVRYWLETMSGKSGFSSRQELLDTVIDVMYYYDTDKNALKSDPLVRLMIDPGEGRYDFTIISCMGVITKGAEGEELAEAFKRLEEKRGVRVVRADTKTARSLEFNAKQIKSALKDVNGPWGLIGYSQGCTNAIRTEVELMGGTPDIREEKLKNFVGRNLLFSALNGSAHGFCGVKKFQNAMEEGDKILKYYQTVFSGKMINLFLESLAKLLDSKLFIHMMGGVRSLAEDGIINLAEEGQFKPDVPSFIISGAVTPGIRPEALDYLSNVLTAQIGHDKHDTQVSVRDSKAHFVWLENKYIDVLKDCDMGCKIQHTHHWSPLLRETEFITTEKDRLRAIYDTPKDRHVFPWVDTMARFGFIKSE